MQLCLFRLLCWMLILMNKLLLDTRLCIQSWTVKLLTWNSVHIPNGELNLEQTVNEYWWKTWKIPQWIFQVMCSSTILDIVWISVDITVVSLALFLGRHLFSSMAANHAILITYSTQVLWSNPGHVGQWTPHFLGKTWPWSTECFENNSVIQSNSSVVSLSSGNLLRHQNYIFGLEVEEGTRKSDFEQTVVVVDGPVPSVDLQ